MKPDAPLFATQRRSGVSRLLPHTKTVVAAVFALAVLAVAVPQAHAAKEIGGFIGGSSTPTDPRFGGLFTQPRDVTVYTGTDGDPTNDKIFSVEGLGGITAEHNSRVQRLGADGDFERAWGKDVDAASSGTGFEVCTVAADCKAGANSGVGAGEFNQPSGIAVDQASDWVYVFDRVNDRVQKFDLDGNFVLMFGLDVNATSAGAGFEVCTQASGDACKAGVTGTEGGAVNGSTGGVPKLEVAQATGDVFVADRSNRRVSQFQPDGTFVRAWGWDVDKTTVDNRFEVCTTTCGAAADAAPVTSNGAFAANNPANVAVDSQNVVYATDSASGTVAQRILRFDADLAPGAAGDASAALLDPIDPTTAGGPLLAGLSTSGVPNGIEIDPDSDGAGADEETLLAVRDPSTGPTVVQELDIPTEAGETPADAVTVIDTHTFDAQAVNGGIGVQSQTGNIYLPVSLVASNFPACGLLIPGCANGAGLIILNSGGGAATTTALPPTAVTTTTAMLTGTVTANGRAFYRFEVAKGGGDFTQVGPTRSVSGSAPVEVSLAATGLSPNALYRVRIVVSKINSLTTIATVNSNEPLFLTDIALPDATTLAASGITSSGALLAGRVDPNGSETTYQFHYGLTDSYGSVIPAPAQPIGSDDGDQIVSQQIAGLLAEQTYHYQVCATSPAGSQCGADRTFTTKAIPPDGDLARAYELVSPADKVSGSGVGAWYFGPGTAGTVGFAAHTAERFAAQGLLGSVLVDSAFSYGNDWAFAQRTPSGWVSHSPITRGGYGSQTYRLLGSPDASDDLSQTVFTSSGTLKPFPEMEPWPQQLGQVPFVSDWDGRWEVIAPTDPAQVSGTIGVLTVAQAAASRQVAIGTGAIRGLLGPSDPTNVAWVGEPGDLVAGGSVYVDDLSSGVSDTFPGTGVRSLVNVCTGTSGVDRTELPLRTAAGKQGAQECPDAAAGRSGRLVSERGAALPHQALDNGISADGDRVFFLSPDPGVGGAGESSCDAAASGEATACPAQLYVRQRNSDGSVVTRWISRTAVADQDASLMAPTVFEGMSEDGDKVFFRTTSPLTVDDPNGAGAPPAGGVTTGTPSSASSDLYMYDLPDGSNADPAGGVLTRVSGGPGGGGDCNVPDEGAGTGSLRFVSSDGARAYFTCAGALPGVAASSNGTLTQASGTPATTSTVNLYLYDGGWRFVTQLPREGGERIGACATVGGGSGAQTLAVVNTTGSGIAVRGDNCVHGSSDGGFVTFWTAGRLTADDPDAVSADFYGFDADADELSRITAAQGGPGGSYVCNNSGDPVNGPLQCFGDGGFNGGTGAITNRVAAPLNVVEDPVTPGDRIAFFQSKSRLVAGDSDDLYDVYQWRNGELSLVSTGVSGRDGAFLKGSDSTGTNVYFATRDRLSWQDVDSVLDVYTARVGGGIPEPPVPAICAVLVGDGCQGTGSAPPVPVDVGSSRSGGANVQARKRMRLSVASPRARARARAARRGVLALRVRVSRPGVVVVSARAGKKRGARKLRVRARRAGVVSVRLRLSRPVRRRLARGRAVRLAVTVRSPGAHKRTLRTTLKRGSR